jgi:GT2 family glycosyltransferase
VIRSDQLDPAIHTVIDTAIRPAMPAGGPPEFAGAVWVGELQETELPAGRLMLSEAEGYGRARLLVRAGRHTRGFVELPVVAGGVEGAALASAITSLPPAPTERDGAAAAVPISVVLCTRDRPEPLRMALTSLLALEYPGEYEILVVDNASRTSATADMVATLDPGRVRLVSEPRPGLARARNAGVLAARHPYVAFTDDDVLVDRWWLKGLAHGFARTCAGPVACVTGIVPSGEVRSRSQLYFERRVWWSSTVTPDQFSLRRPPADEPLFPFRVGRYGTGANFAVRRDVLLSLGGFDEALGVGSPTGGGEDIDIFVRVIAAGHALCYEPSAVVWHRHRADDDALLVQARGYGLGLGAWLTVVASDRRMAPQALRRAVRAARHLLITTRVDIGTEAGRADDGATAYSAGLRRAELLSVLRGPLALLSARRSGARRRPLSGARS